MSSRRAARTLNALFVLQASLAVAILAGDVVRRLNVVVVDNWADMKTQCEAGYEVSLAQSFEGDSASYPGEIDFSGKVCVIRGNGKTLDAGGAGRFFTGSGTGSSLEVHDLTLRNGNVSDFKAVFLDFSVNFPPRPGGGHATSRVELFVLRVVLMWRSTTQRLLATLPAL